MSLFVCFFSVLVTHFFSLIRLVLCSWVRCFQFVHSLIASLIHSLFVHAFVRLFFFLIASFVVVFSSLLLFVCSLLFVVCEFLLVLRRQLVPKLWMLCSISVLSRAQHKLQTALEVP